MGDKGKKPDIEQKSVTRYCTARVVNHWGKEITNVKLTHKSGTNLDAGQWDSIPIDERGPTMRIVFQTGGIIPPPHDYWHIEFRVEPDKFHCKTNFYCNLTSDDADKIIDCIVKVGVQTLTVSTYSSSCEVSLSKN